jgi:DNA-binding transcriptional regulator YiaG
MGDPGVSVEELAEIRALLATGRAREIREQAMVGQSELARDLGVTQGAVALWEGGQRLPRGRVALDYLRVLRSLERIAGPA